MNEGEDNYVENDLVYAITGCAMEVLNELGHGLREKTYERAICIEFDIQKMLYEQQKIYLVTYKGHHIDDYIPDLIVNQRAVVDLKTVESILPEHIGQILNYLKITECPVGIIYNFKHPKLQWKKVVLQN